MWYDYGPAFAQTAYIPMYLTSGKTPAGDRVLTLFPAVNMKELDNTPIPNLSGSRDVLQLYTFNPRPANNPPAPRTPLAGTPYPTIPGLPGISGFPESPEVTIGAPGSATGACYGLTVDYEVSCTDNTGTVVCKGSVGLHTDQNGKNDPMGVCKNGCQAKSATITAPSGSNPCEEYAKQNNLEISGATVWYKNKEYKGEPVQCQIKGCPC